ncbi:MAG: FtsX-like permease family protein [Devosia sp.]|nr:FtsX-like permease family protein [Devosia sp.]
MIISWMRGLLAARYGRLLGSALGVTIAIALIASLGTFMRQSAAEMTNVAVSTVPVDWQAQLDPGANSTVIASEAGKAVPLSAQQLVGYADVTGFEFRSADGATQVTGGGKVVGLQTNYWTAFPKSARLLSGSPEGVLLQQQTAANLHAAPGDAVTVHRDGGPDIAVRIAGIVDLTNADTFFQAVGVPAGAAPQAPPDNALFMPLDDWKRQFDPQAVVRPDSVRLQIHARIDRSVLPPDPQDAFAEVTHRGNNFEARVAGSAVLANNLGARLDATRGDASYAYVLFIFLGSPGVVLAALLTFAVSASGAAVRRRDQALLRLRGARMGVLMRMAAVEGVAVAAIAVIGGLSIALIVTGAVTGWKTPAWQQAPALATAASVGIVLALGAILVPAWRSARQLSISTDRRAVGRDVAPLWRRLYIDGFALAIAALAFWRAGATGYQVVLAPEGVTAISVDYTAFAAPFFLLVGGSLLAWRLGDLFLVRGKTLVSLALSWAGALSNFVAASLSRQRRRVGAGIAMTALAFAFAASTAIFNTTFEGQARVDAELTNGSDVTVSGTTASPAGSLFGPLSSLPGVTVAEAMQHRYAYVGNDLQDLYGIDPRTVSRATDFSNAYFGNGDAAGTLKMLASQPDAVLVSEETVTDFQLSPGDRLNLRLQGKDNQYHVVPFTFVGVAREFPTAPRDSFMVANATYVEQQTGIAAREVVLLRVAGSTSQVASAARNLVKQLPSVTVHELTGSIQQIGSGLVSIDLHGLTLIELGFAVAMAVATTGLVLALGFADRRRTYAVMTILGAGSRQVAAFVFGEAVVILVAGAVLGLLLGWGVAFVLVKVLEGVFDPPPEALTIPWAFLGVLFLCAALANALASWNAIRLARISPSAELRGGQ